MGSTLMHEGRMKKGETRKRGERGLEQEKERKAMGKR